jgi:predicted histone-like DNA-binding protein
MPVYYQISPVKSHFDPEGKVRYIARPCKRNKILTKKGCEIIAQRSSGTEADVMHMLYSIMDLIPELVMENGIVDLKPFGIFSLSFKCKPEDSPDKITYRSVSDFRIQFRPDPALKRRLLNTVVRKG